jgi:DNA-binding NarL/FixJ family response regulator
MALSPFREKHVDRVRILLADDHEEFLAAAVRLLESEFDVVGAVGEGQALLDAAARLGPDVVVLDVSMPVLNGIETARRLRKAGSTARIVFLTMHEDPDYVCSALAAGAQGYVVKSRLASDLALALRETLAGRTFVSPLAV